MITNVLTELKEYVLITGEKVAMDLFDAQGNLLLAKGQLIIPSIALSLKTRKLFSARGECSQQSKNGVLSSFSHQLILDSMSSLHGVAGMLRTDRLLPSVDLVKEIYYSLLKNETLSKYFQVIKKYSLSTYIHCINVTLLAGTFAQELKYPTDAINQIIYASLFHDIGKLKIPLWILEKRGVLSPAEFEEIQKHPKYGLDMVSQQNFADDILNAIYQHHEKWNGTGYPLGIKKANIHPFSQILAVCDCFDALIQDRSFRSKYSPYFALEIIAANEGIAFSPEIVPKFIGMFNLYPENSLVKLNTGEIAQVTEVTYKHPARPIVTVIKDTDGNSVVGSWQIDLTKDKEHYISEVWDVDNNAPRASLAAISLALGV